ncbi:pyridoxamine 5'-phosphate oxidase family protein [Mycobacterium xenopi]|uniref:pyridoxamine 5'-phosphate oxidase family protein n=1 Tax=Mycobacterium xenopi TaxID=1789 RepID=UPI0009DA9117
MSACNRWAGDILFDTDVGSFLQTCSSSTEPTSELFYTAGRTRPTVLFRTAEGTKLVSAAINNRVLFEADDHNVAEGWSVIVKGTARMLRTKEEIEEAERAQLLPWTATLKQHYVRILPISVTGRRFHFGPEPSPENTFA